VERFTVILRQRCPWGYLEKGVLTMLPIRNLVKYGITFIFITLVIGLVFYIVTNFIFGTNIYEYLTNLPPEESKLKSISYVSPVIIGSAIAFAGALATISLSLVSFHLAQSNQIEYIENQYKALITDYANIISNLLNVMSIYRYMKYYESLRCDNYLHRVHNKNNVDDGFKRFIEALLKFAESIEQFGKNPLAQKVFKEYVSKEENNSYIYMIKKYIEKNLNLQQLRMNPLPLGETLIEFAANIKFLVLRIKGYPFNYYIKPREKAIQIDKYEENNTYYTETIQAVGYYLGHFTIGKTPNTISFQLGTAMICDAVRFFPDAKQWCKILKEHFRYHKDAVDKAGLGGFDPPAALPEGFMEAVDKLRDRLVFPPLTPPREPKMEAVDKLQIPLTLSREPKQD
jgi:hypothetical protein